MSDQCDKCGRFVDAMAPGVSGFQSYTRVCLSDYVFRCAPCTDRYGAGRGIDGPNRAAPSFPTAPHHPHPRMNSPTGILEDLDDESTRPTGSSRA
jgi:hypothetical protein